MGFNFRKWSEGTGTRSGRHIKESQVIFNFMLVVGEDTQPWLQGA